MLGQRALRMDSAEILEPEVDLADESLGPGDCILFDQNNGGGLQALLQSSVACE